jgi:hypothetical protein
VQHRDAAAQHRPPIVLQAVEPQQVNVACLDQAVDQPVQP